MEFKMLKLIILLVACLNLCPLVNASEDIDMTEHLVSAHLSDTAIKDKKNVKVKTNLNENLIENAENEKEIKQVRHMSKARIKQEREKFVLQEETNRKLKYAIMAGLWTAGSGVLIWFLFGGNDNNEGKLSKQDVEKFKLLVVKELKKNDDANKQVGPWYKHLYSGFKSTVKSNVHSIGTMLITALIFNKSFELINSFLPSFEKIKDKIFGKRNIGWFINHKTQLIKIVNDLKSLIENYNDSESQISNNELISLISLFTMQLERILGFVEYRTNQLAQINNTYALTGQTVKNTIFNKIHEFCNSVDLVLNQDVNKNIVLDKFKNLLLFVVSQLNMFATAETDAGFADDSSSAVVLDNLHQTLEFNAKEEQALMDEIQRSLMGEMPDFEHENN